MSLTAYASIYLKPSQRISAMSIDEERGQSELTEHSHNHSHEHGEMSELSDTQLRIGQF